MTKISNLLLSNLLHLFSFLFIGLTILAIFFFLGSSTIFAQNNIKEDKNQPFINQPTVLTTQSRFDKKTLEIPEIIPFKTEYQKTDDLEFGTQNVIQEGKDGKRTIIIEVTYFEGKEYSRDQVGEKIEDPVDKIVGLGTKKIWRTQTTADGDINYFAKFRVWSTSYDQNCYGCDGTTATGMKTGFGVIAVDPTIIPLGTKVYVPGYGFAVAGDTGGAIKGYTIDLGFDNVSQGWWSSRYTDIYLL